MIDIIVNPYAGGIKKMAKKLSLVQEKLTELGVAFAVHKTEYAKHAIALTKKVIAEGATTVIAMGGDGTLNEVINGFDNFENVNFGLLPCGTGNDFANHLGLPHDPLAALDIILNKEATYIDYMQMPNVRAINIVGMGIDVEVLKLYEKLEKKTKIAYTNCLIKTLLRYKCINFTSEINGVKTEHKSFLACVANASMFGGGIEVCPTANPTDGKFNFVFVDEIKGLKLLPALLKLKAGKLFTLKSAHCVLADKIIIHNDKESVINVDGELYENLPFEIELVHNKLKMFR